MYSNEQIALNLQQYVPSVRPEPVEYLDPGMSWGSFSILKKSRKSNSTTQASYKLSELDEVIKSLNSANYAEYDIWISQASFNRFNRRKANLHSIAVSFVDLDYYNVPHLANLDSEKVLLEHVFPLLLFKKIPLPSYVIDSGKGLQIKWITEQLPARALPRWDRLQTELCNVLKDLGADSNAKDASRVLRLQNTINQKTGNVVKVIWSDTDKNCLPVRFEFGMLCDRVLPYTQERLAELRKQAQDNKRLFKSVTQSSSADIINMLRHPGAHTLENLNWNRLHDLKKLISLRSDDMGDGLREPTAFYLCNFYALRYAQSGLSDSLIWHEFYQLCKTAAPHWDNKKSQAKVSNVYDLMKKQAAGSMKIWNGKDVPMLYVPSNETMINMFSITDNEQGQLKTIIDRTEKQRRNTEYQSNKRHKSGTQERTEYANSVKSESDKRMQEVITKTSQGFKQAEIAVQMGISLNAVKSLKKRAKSSI
ncbi:MAG: hypothetical protein ACI9T7_000494 [Oleiphilaceae bacterium]|jgi:hypothetical protein